MSPFVLLLLSCAIFGNHFLVLLAFAPAPTFTSHRRSSIVPSFQHQLRVRPLQDSTMIIDLDDEEDDDDDDDNIKDVDIIADDYDDEEEDDDDEEDDDEEEDPYTRLASSEFQDDGDGSSSSSSSALATRTTNNDNSTLDSTTGLDWGGALGKLRQRVQDVETGKSQDPSHVLFRMMSSQTPNQVIGQFVQSANPQVVQAMSGAVSSLLGGLSSPKMGVETVVKASGDRIGSLCFQLQMTG
jgi:hypothetical protein